MAVRVHAGDVGTVVVRTIKDENGNAVDISLATTLQFLFVSPAGVLITKTATMLSGPQGQMSYTTIVSDTVFATSGAWEVQAYIVLPSGKWHSDISTVQVERVLA